MDPEKPMIQPHQFLNTIPRFENALCAELEDQDLFFPDGKAEEAKRLPQLRAICRGCVERKECLEYSIREEIPYGIWGGKTPTERGVVLKRSEILKRKERVLKLRNRGISTEDIAQIVGIKIHSVYRIFSDANRARKREDQSNQKTNTPSEDLSPSLDSAP
jgi:hypothetical protein